MYIIALLGAVDSGKTTFFKTYTNSKVVERKETTQQIRFKEANLCNQSVLVVDLPGHDLFSTEKSVALTICDVLLYVTDYNNPNISILNNFKTEKPVIILMNKVDVNFKENLSLKELCKKEEKKITLYNLYEDYRNKIKDCVLERPLQFFLDIERNADLYENYVVFPISLKTKWATEELATFLKKYVFLNVQKSSHNYLYLKNKLKNTYLLLKPSTKDSLFLNIQNKHYYLKNFEYNKVTKEYHIPPLIVNALKSNASLLKVYDRSDLDRETIQESVLCATPIAETNTLESISKKLKDFGNIISKLQVEVYGSTWEKTELLSKIMAENKISCFPLKLLCSEQNLNPCRIRLTWAPMKQKTKNIYHYVSEDLYELIDSFINFLQKQKEKEKEKVSRELEKFTILKVLEDQIFKNHKKELVVGARMIFGNLDLEQEQDFYLIDANGHILNEVKIESIQSNKKNYYKWKHIDTSFAIKLKLKEYYEERPGFLICKKAYDRKNFYAKLFDKKQDHTKELSLAIKRIKQNNLNII